MGRAAWIGAAATGVAILVVAAAGATGDGDRLVFSFGVGGHSAFEIASVRPDGSGFTRLTEHLSGGSDAEWTRDGRAILFRTEAPRDDSLWMIARNGTSPRRLGSATDAVSPSGRWIAVPTDAGLEIWTTHHPRKLRTLRVRGSGFDLYVGATLWSSNERYVALYLYTDSPTAEYQRVVVARVDGMKVWSLTPRRDGVFEAVIGWAPDDRSVVIEVDGSRVERVSIEGRSRRVLDRRSWDDAAWSKRRQLAFVARGGIYVTDEWGRRTHRVVASAAKANGTDAPSNPTWSPSGRELAFSERGKVFVTTVGGRRRRVGSLSDVQSVDWSPDGGSLVVATERDWIATVDVRTGAAKALIAPVADRDAVASPDGEHIAYTRIGPVEGVYIRDGAGAERRLGSGRVAEWSPDGARLLVNRGKRLVIVEAATGRTVDLARSGRSPAWSPDGAAVAFAIPTFWPDDEGEPEHGYSTLYVVRVQGKTLRALARFDLQVEDLAWSPDSAVVAVATADDTFGTSKLEIVNVASRARRTIDCGWCTDVAWSRDGAAIAFFDLFRHAIYVVHGDGGGKRSLVSLGKLDVGELAWSPDGDRLAFVGGRSSDDEDVYVVQKDGRALKRLTRVAAEIDALSWG